MVISNERQKKVVIARSGATKQSQGIQIGERKHKDYLAFGLTMKYNIE